MSNVYSNASFAVLSVMKAVDAANTKIYRGSTVFVQRKPEENYGNITVISYSDDRYGIDHDLRIEDFDQQEAFEANVVPKIASDIATMTNETPVIISNSNISINSYVMNGNEISN